MTEDIKYYNNLKKHKDTLVNLLTDESCFSHIPKTWYVIVVDIENSTKAVNEGKHHQVNLTATGAIISVLNTIRKEKKNIEIPYFFGGDGATFIVPQIILKSIIVILENYSLHIKRNTNLTLRVGYVPVNTLASEKHNLKIAKHQLTAQLTIPVVLGNSLKKAEEYIKKKFEEKNTINFKENLLNLEGMECRWKQIKPFHNKQKVICLLLDATTEINQREIYKNVLAKMDANFGAFKDRQPLEASILKLNYNISKIWKEMKVSLANKSLTYLIKNWTSTLIGKFYLNLSEDGKQYLKQISQLSHTFMLDGMINTIFIADEDKIKPFIEYLDKLENDNKIIYGIHITHASVMSCYVLDRKTKHSHFVDGTEGGYTSAAKMLKRKLKNI